VPLIKSFGDQSLKGKVFAFPFYFLPFKIIQKYIKISGNALVNMLKVKTILLIFWLFFTLPVPLSFSQSPGMGPNPAMGMRHWKGEAQCWRASELDLSAEQMKGFDLIQQTYFQEVRSLRIQLFLKRLELQEFLTNPKIKTESIRAKQLETTELRSKLEEKAIEYLIKLRNLLTQDQLKRWCPEKEFSLLREMMHGVGPMSPVPPRRLPPEE
jgi:Spy/CpxP family protein refolding chaperone